MDTDPQTSQTQGNSDNGNIPELNTETQPLSKNAQKRLAKAARLAELKKERRAYEKEKKKEKKRALAAKRAAGELEDSEGEDAPRKKAKTEGKRTPFDARIVVDLGFDDLMSENEIKSLTSQLAFTYSANRKAVRPFASVLFTSLDKRTFTRLEGISNAAYKRWHDTEWWHESYERLWLGQTTQAESSGSNEATEKDDNNGNAHAKTQTTTQTASQESVVYLTADSEDELNELKEGETYIIGGICDHNRYKSLCLNKSAASGIRSARLPIGTYLAELRTRKVLTVNQTFEILLKWAETKDWKQALDAVVPKRKFNEKGKAGRRNETESQTEPDRPTELIVDATILEEDGVDDEYEDVETAGGEFGTVVVAAKDKFNASSGSAIIMDDDAHPEAT